MISKNATLQFIENFDQLSDSAQTDSPDWLSSIRTKHVNRILDLGIPTVKDEEWKYTSLADLNKHSFKIQDASGDIDIDRLSHYVKSNETNIVFVNGHYSESLSNVEKLPKGIRFSTLKKAVSDNKENIQERLEKFDEYKQSTFSSINNALHEDGPCIIIDKGTISKELVHIVHITVSEDNDTLSVPRTYIDCQPSSEVTILESHLALNNDAVYLNVPITDVYLEENAILHYCNSQNDSHKAYHVGQIRVWQERNANFDGFSFMTGGLITRNNLDIVINGEGGNANLNALYAINHDQHVDNHSSVDHRVPNCTSNQLYKGILKGDSRAVFNGKIFVKPIAQQTNSYQLNNNLLLGEGCRVDTKPQLEIFADDVKCTHGATIGQLEEDEIFYLQTRNIERKAAIEMLSRGFADEALNAINDESILEKLHILIEPMFTGN